MRGLTRAAKRAGEMAFNAGGGVVNWFPGHMAAASRAIRDRLKLADLVIEVRDARVSSPPTLSFILIARGPNRMFWVLFLALWWCSTKCLGNCNKLLNRKINLFGSKWNM
jgi:hypothetical protein